MLEFHKKMFNANVTIFNTYDWVLEIWKKVNKGITSQLSEQGSQPKLKQIRKINIQMLRSEDTRVFFPPLGDEYLPQSKAAS